MIMDLCSSIALNSFIKYSNINIMPNAKVINYNSMSYQKGAVVCEKVASSASSRMDILLYL